MRQGFVIQPKLAPNSRQSPCISLSEYWSYRHELPSLVFLFHKMNHIVNPPRKTNGNPHIQNFPSSSSRWRYGTGPSQVTLDIWIPPSLITVTPRDDFSLSSVPRGDPDLAWQFLALKQRWLFRQTSLQRCQTVAAFGALSRWTFPRLL